MTTSFLSLNSKHDFCYVYSEAKSLRQPATAILLIYFGDPYFSLQNLQEYQQLATRQMPAQPFYTCFLFTTTTSTKANSQLRPLLNS